jgi:prepilin-type N-terminal cleavage/methylation domain-containing protein
MLHKMCRRLSNEKAFTLIEVIVSLVLIGILSAIAGLGLVQITQGYIFAKQNAETVQKAQIAMTRIVKELGAATRIETDTLPTTARIKYTRTGTGSVINTITISDVVQISGTANGTLINNVITPPSAFAYFDAAGGSITTFDATTVPTIRRVDVTLKVTGASNQSSVFTNSAWIMESYQ